MVLTMLLIGLFGGFESYGLLDVILRTAVLAGMFSIYIAIMIKTTRNYFRKKRQAEFAQGDVNIDDNL